VSFADTERNDGAVEQCIEELSDFIGGVQGYSPTLLAVALRVHLETLLQALLEAKSCTPKEVRDFVRELERDVLHFIGSSRERLRPLRAAHLRVARGAGTETDFGTA